MNVKSSMLNPVTTKAEDDHFFKRRHKRKKREAKKWLRRINKAEDMVTIRKTLTRMSKRHSSMPDLQRPQPISKPFSLIHRTS